MRDESTWFTQFAVGLMTVVLVGFAYLESFSLSCRCAKTHIPCVYRPMRYVLESPAAPSLRRFLSSTGADPDTAHCMLYEPD
jgi:hypothetical protein